MAVVRVVTVVVVFARSLVDILLPFLSTGESIMNDDEKEINNDNEEANDQVPSASVSLWGRSQKLAVLLYRVSDE